MNLPRSQTSTWRAVVRVLRSPATAQNLLHSVTSAVFPADCQVCGDPLCDYSRVPVCDSCWKNLPQQHGPACSRCGESLGISDFGQSPVADMHCRPCKLAPPAFTHAIAHGPYSGAMRPLLHLLKYSGMEPIADQLGRAMAVRLAQQPDLPSAMIVVPVPLFRDREKQRGFNQSELLARAIVRAIRTLRPEWRGELAAKILERRRATQSQAGLSLSERRRNLRGAFFVSDADILRDRHVLLVDDIYTTGATARACSSILKRSGAASVWVATAARAQRYETVQYHGFQSAAVEPPADELQMARDVARWDSTIHLQALGTDR